MNMTRLKISKTLLAVTLGSILVSSSVLAETNTMDNVQSTANSAGEKIDSSLNKVGNFMDDSSITAKVKAALVDDKNIKSAGISVKTDNKVVTLSGVVESQAQAEHAVSIAKAVEGVKSVNNDLKTK
ncbi:BON domain-containing protein [Enterobacter sp. RHBSTW-00901]|jgi:hyperosmotically inducible protein|nr:BON domain-containing protein [Enterobacter sp. RHBSTW-00901]BBS35688.1 hypothetical protein WP5S18E01_05350 [Enterobacter cloacae]